MKSFNDATRGGIFLRRQTGIESANSLYQAFKDAASGQAIRRDAVLFVINKYEEYTATKKPPEGGTKLIRQLCHTR